MTNATTIPGGLQSREPDKANRTPAEIEADIEATRARLAGTVDAIAEKVKPANVARRGAESAKAQVVDPAGNLRTERVAILAVGVAVVVGLLIWRRTR